MPDRRTIEPPAPEITNPSADLRVELHAAARFVVLATLSLTAAGLLLQGGQLPWVKPGASPGLLQTISSLGPQARAAFASWQATGALISLALPSLALLTWGRRDEQVRRALAPQVLVLLAQIGSEAVLAQVFFADIVVLTGLLYTGYRLRQLWHARTSLTATRGPAPSRHQAVRLLINAGLAFWTTNLAFLLALALPAMLP